jgi:hypothetical protein
MTNKVVVDEIRILSPTAILGYGFPESSFQAGLARKPHLIAVDAGWDAPGRCYLGAGLSFTNRQAVQRDLRHMLAPAGCESRSSPVPRDARRVHPHVPWTSW